MAKLTEQLQQFANGNRDLKKIEVDPLDKDEYVSERCKKLIDKGKSQKSQLKYLASSVPETMSYIFLTPVVLTVLTGAVALLVQMSREDTTPKQGGVSAFSATETTKEAIAGAFMSFATEQKTRGKMVADGAVKSLLQLIEHSKSEKVNFRRYISCKFHRIFY